MATTLNDKWQAQQVFWGGFSLPAYDERSVPDDAVMPYITYEAVGGSIEEQTTISASLWYKSNSWLTISQKADAIAQAIGQASAPAIKITNGYMKLRLPQGRPFAERMDEPNDGQVRRIRMTVEIEFLTAY